MDKVSISLIFFLSMIIQYCNALVARSRVSNNYWMYWMLIKRNYTQLQHLYVLYYTLYKQLQHILNLFCLECLQILVNWQRLLTMQLPLEAFMLQPTTDWEWRYSPGLVWSGNTLVVVVVSDIQKHNRTNIRCTTFTPQNCYPRVEAG
jgi:hypothetical protein